MNLDLPVDNIKRIEIVRGPGSVLYGAGAFLGVINIVTESVDTFRRDELTLGGGSFESFLYNFRYGTTFHEVSLAGFLQYSYTGGPHLDVPADLQTADRRAPSPRSASRPRRLAPGETVDDRKARGREPRPGLPRLRPEHPHEEGERGRLRGRSRRRSATRTASPTPRSAWPGTGRAPCAWATCAVEGRLQPERARRSFLDVLPPGLHPRPRRPRAGALPGRRRLPGQPQHAAGGRGGHAVARRWAPSTR